MRQNTARIVRCVITFIVANFATISISEVYDNEIEQEIKSTAVELLKQAISCPLLRTRTTLTVSHFINKFDGNTETFSVIWNSEMIGFSDGLPQTSSSEKRTSAPFRLLMRPEVSGNSVSLRCRNDSRCLRVGTEIMINGHLETCDSTAAVNAATAIALLSGTDKHANAPLTRSVAASLWDHNGSIVALTANGNDRRFHYRSPRQALADRGVSEGVLLFEGKKIGSVYEGNAFVFSRECGAASYAVRGPVSSDSTTVELQGNAPIRDASCNTINTRPDRLIFKFRTQQ
jgi:hypothetical protein